MKKLWIIAFSLSLLSGCAATLGFFSAVSSDKVLERLDETLNLYDASIRWGAYDKVLLVQKDRGNVPDYDALKPVKVTTVRELSKIMSEDDQQCDRRVEISYYRDGENIVKTLVDTQTWDYESDREVWLLDGGLPDFQ
ncbi:MAG: hypothetical protein ABFS02_07915 [Pseudomonadota bacterium]